MIICSGFLPRIINYAHEFLTETYTVYLEVEEDKIEKDAAGGKKPGIYSNKCFLT